MRKLQDLKAESHVRVALAAKPFVDLDVTIEGLKPLWLPFEIREPGGRLALPYRPLSADYVTHVRRAGAMAKPMSLFLGWQVWRYLIIDPTLIPLKGRMRRVADGVLVQNWAASFRLLLPLGLFNIDHPALRAEMGDDPTLYAARLFAELGRAKGPLRRGNDYGTYTVSEWRARSVTRRVWRYITWVEERTDDDDAA